MMQAMRVWIAPMLSMLAISGCFAQDYHPSDQLIKEEFKITEQWQEFTFKNPLVTEPYIQYIHLLSCQGKHKLEEVGKDVSNYFTLSHRFKRLSDDAIIEPEVIAIIEDKPYRFAYSVTTWFSKPELKGCISMGYAINGIGQKNGFYLPKSKTISSVRLKANKAFNIDGIYWVASDYWQAPNEHWKDVNASKIINLEKLPQQ